MQTTAKKTNEFIQAGPSEKRVVKMQGNVAYISSDIVRYANPAPGVRTTPRKPVKTVARPAAKTAARPAAKTAAQPRTGFVSTLVVLFIAFGALAVLVSRYAVACSIGAQNNSLKMDIEAAQAKMDELSLNIELRDDLQYVQDTAENELGMTYPTPEQKINIDKTANGQ